MSTYESTFICSPEVPAEKIDELVEKVKKIIENANGKVVVTQQLGRKRLAYPIQKFREGSYVYFEFTGTGEIVSPLETLYKVNDSVIRYLTVKIEKKKKPVVKAVTAPVAPAATEAAKPAVEEVKTNESNTPTA